MNDITLAMEFSDRHKSTSEPESKSGFKLRTIAEVMKRSLETDWAIDKYVPADSTAMIFGKPSSGKSLAVMEMAYCVGIGQDYCGYPVTQGSVIYIAGEGSAGINKRFKALSLVKGASPDNIHVSDLSMDLYSATSVEQVLNAIKNIPNIVLIIIDTLHRNSTGEESSAKDFAVVMRNCDKLRFATGAAILLVHHSGHDSQTRGRGSSAMTAAMDVEYKVSMSGKQVTLHCTKMKDDEKPKDLKFDLKSVNIGQDAGGNPITAPVLEKSTTFFTTAKSTALNHTEKLTLDTLTELSANNSIPLVRSDWKEAFAEQYTVKQDSKDPAGAKRKQFDRSLSSLLDKGYVVEDNGCYSLPGSQPDTGADPIVAIDGVEMAEKDD